MRCLYLILPTVLLMACHGVTRTPHFFQGKGFVLTDTTYKLKSVFRVGASYPIYYKGEMRDTIKIGLFYRGEAIPREDFTGAIGQMSSSNLHMFIDTSVKTSITFEHYTEDGKLLPDSMTNIPAYLLTIKNTSDSSISLGSVNRYYCLYRAYREIKNNKGEWIKIEDKISEMSICGTGRRAIYLKPGEVIVSKAGRYGGNTPTLCRIVLSCFGNKVYSNTFIDNI